MKGPTQRSINSFFGNPQQNVPPKAVPLSRSTETPVQQVNSNTVYIYTDGSCIYNGTPRAKAGMGIYFGPNDSRNVSMRVEGKQSNNTGELSALLHAMKLIESKTIDDPSLKVVFVTDSKYCVLCMTSYGDKCAHANWSKDIPNKSIVQETYQLYKKYESLSQWNIRHIKAHTNRTDCHSIGNENADRLANEAIGITPSSKPVQDNRIYLQVPYSKKDAIKDKGGKWDPKKKKWYILNTHPEQDELCKIYS
jgi:ribonuclease HI